MGWLRETLATDYVVDSEFVVTAIAPNGCAERIHLNFVAAFDGIPAIVEPVDTFPSQTASRASAYCVSIRSCFT